MKLFSALACSALLMGGAAAFAADSASAPAASASASASASTTTPSPMTHATKSAKSARTAKVDQCSKDATAKGLKGKARHSFLKDCRASKAAPKAQ